MFNHCFSIVGLICQLLVQLLPYVVLDNLLAYDGVFFLSLSSYFLPPEDRSTRENKLPVYSVFGVLSQSLSCFTIPDSGHIYLRILFSLHYILIFYFDVE